MPDRIKAPAIKNPEEFEIKLPPCQKLVLNNGVPVYLVSGGAEDVMKIEWVISAGNSFENKVGIAAAVNRLLKNGTSKKSSFEISQYFEFYGAFFSAGCFNEYAVLTLETLSKHIREVLPVVAELITDAVFPENEIRIYQQNSIQKLKVSLEKCDFVANREIDIMLYGNKNPYGRKTSIEDISGINKNDLTDFYTDFYQNAECKIFAAGKLPDGFDDLLNEYFGALNLHQEKQLKEFAREPALQKKLHIRNDQNGVQSAIRIAREFPNRKHPDFKKAMVLNAILGGYFGSRLMSNIREEKGYTYGIYSYIQNHLEYSSWIITTEAGTDVAEATIEEVYKEMNELREEVVDDEEMRLVKNYLIGHQLAALDGPFHIIDRWKSLILNKLDEQFYYDTIEVIKTVSTSELREIAIKYLVPEDFYELSVV